MTRYTEEGLRQVPGHAPARPVAAQRAARRQPPACMPDTRPSLPIDFAAWHAALAEAKLPRPAKATAVLLIAFLGADREATTTRKALAAALRLSERTTYRRLRLFEDAGLIRIAHHSATQWTVRASIPLPAGIARRHTGRGGQA